MKAGVLKETSPGETRVAVVPGVVSALGKAGIEVVLEAGAGEAAGYSRRPICREGRDAHDARAGAEGRDARAVGPLLRGGAYRDAIARLEPHQVLVGFLDPYQAPERAKVLGERGVTSFAMELMPRISRAQSMDALSSMATIAGYKAVLLAAVHAAADVPDDDDGGRHDQRPRACS